MDSVKDNNLDHLHNSFARDRVLVHNTIITLVSFTGFDITLAYAIIIVRSIDFTEIHFMNKGYSIKERVNYI